MAFAFGFASDDGDDVEDDTGVVEQPTTQREEDNEFVGLPAKEESVDDMLATLPDRLHYSLLPITSPLGRTLFLPRRELYDVRVQLMAEDEAGNDETLSDIEKSDIRTGVYEGGFKTWECSVDLASLLLDRGPRKDIDDLERCSGVVELGCGTALPSLILFHHALLNSIPLTFTLQDYNTSVLRLVTLPNLLLTWATTTTPPLISTSSEDHQGDLEITPDLLAAFRSSLQSSQITIQLLSGSWSPSLASLIPASPPDLGTLILGAETIYSPAATSAFVAIVVTLLKRVKMAKAMIGAKRLYFGVGGSVDGLKEACREVGAVAYEIENHGVPGMEEGRGVGRALVEVQMF